MAYKPKIDTFLIADNVIQEKGSNKWSVIGIFSQVFSNKFPCFHSSMALYIKISDAEGEYDIRVEFTDADEKKLSVFEGIKLKVDSKLNSVDLGIRTQNLMIPKPGKYHFSLYFNNEFCESCLLIASEN